MTDPLDVLRSPSSPIAPDPAFAARLRARLVHALDPDPEGAPMSTLTTTDRPAASDTGATVDPVITPYLAVADARAAIEWYVDALGFRRRGEPIVMPDGRIGHAEVELPGGGLVMLSDEHPEIGVVAPPRDVTAGVNVTLHARVDDVDAVTRRAVEAGAFLEREPADHPYGRNATLRDPFGHRWMLSSPVSTAAAVTGHPYTARHGDLAYVSLWVGDVERAAAFYAAVLGWRFAPGEPGRARQVEGLSMPHGLWATGEHHTLFLCAAVDDVDAAVARVRAAGGTADGPHDEPYGRIANCADDQGMAFALVQATPGGRRGPVNGEVPGDVSYVTVETVDTARFRAFFGAVLGWRFAPGHVPDGWGVEDTVPMIGVHGGHDTPRGVPMYRVEDIQAAVAAVRAAGGTSTDPQQQPYGISAECVDDQGTRFYLGQQ